MIGGKESRARPCQLGKEPYGFRMMWVLGVQQGVKRARVNEAGATQLPLGGGRTTHRRSMAFAMYLYL